jgi:hypothetical protein
VDLEVLIGRALLLAVAIELGQQFVEILFATAVHPAVVARSAAQGGIGMSTDENR